MSKVTALQLRTQREQFARSLDRMTIEEIADAAVREFYELSQVAENLLKENAELRKSA